MVRRITRVALAVALVLFGSVSDGRTDPNCRDAFRKLLASRLTGSLPADVTIRVWSRLGELSDDAVLGAQRLVEVAPEGRVAQLLDRTIATRTAAEAEGFLRAAGSWGPEARKGVSKLAAVGSESQFGRIVRSVADAPAGNRATTKLSPEALFATQGEILDGFFRTVGHETWTAADLDRVDRLATVWQRFAVDIDVAPQSTEEALFDWMATVAKYARREGGSELSSARIVRQLDLFQSSSAARQAQLDDALQQLMSLEKSYGGTLAAGQSKVDLDWLARNMEGGGFGRQFGGETVTNVEELARYTKISYAVDDALDETVGPNSTLVRAMQRYAGGEAPMNLANKVKGALANKDVADSFRSHSLAVTEFRTASGKYVDTLVDAAETPRTVRVLELDATGEVVEVSRVVPAGERIAVETKALAEDTWDSGSIAVATQEVRNGFGVVDPAAERLGQSLIAVTPDISPGKLKQLLESIRSMPPYSNRAGVIILQRRALGGTGSYNDIARGLIRDLRP